MFFQELIISNYLSVTQRTVHQKGCELPKRLEKAIPFSSKTEPTQLAIKLSYTLADKDLLVILLLLYLFLRQLIITVLSIT